MNSFKAFWLKLDKEDRWMVKMVALCLIAQVAMNFLPHK